MGPSASLCMERPNNKPNPLAGGTSGRGCDMQGSGGPLRDSVGMLAKSFPQWHGKVSTLPISLAPNLCPSSRFRDHCRNRWITTGFEIRVLSICGLGGSGHAFSVWQTTTYFHEEIRHGKRRPLLGAERQLHEGIDGQSSGVAVHHSGGDLNNLYTLDLLWVNFGHI